MGQILLPQNHLHSSELKQVTDNLLSFIDADSIYISTRDNQPETKTIISVFVKKGSSQTSEELYNITEKLFQSYPQFAYRIFDHDWAAYSFRKGNPFFLSHCSIRELVYTADEHGSIFNPTAVNVHRLLKNANRRYTKDREETDTINRELSMYIRNGNHLQAAYILHQTIRRLYYTASWFLTGESIPSRSIAEQQTYIKPFSAEIGSLFDPKDITDAVLLKQLDSACEAVRNNKPTTINLETIPAAVLKAEWLQQEVQKLFSETILSCEGKFPDVSETKSPKPVKKNPDTPKSEDTKLLEELQDLATRHYKKLQPDPKTEGVYTAKIKFIGYTDLMCFATDLIRLSITSYTENEDSSYGGSLIVNPKVNIANILEVVIQLLPLHEIEYLDILAEMFSEHQRKLKKLARETQNKNIATQRNI